MLLRHLADNDIRKHSVVTCVTPFSLRAPFPKHLAQQAESIASCPVITQLSAPKSLRLMMQPMLNNLATIRAPQLIAANLSPDDLSELRENLQSMLQECDNSGYFPS